MFRFLSVALVVAGLCAVPRMAEAGGGFVNAACANQVFVHRQFVHQPVVQQRFVRTFSPVVVQRQRFVSPVFVQRQFVPVRSAFVVRRGGLVPAVGRALFGQRVVVGF